MCLARRVRVRAPHMPRLNVPLWRMCGGLAGGHRRIGSGGFSALSSARGPMRMCFMSLLERARDVVCCIRSRFYYGIDDVVCE